MWIWRTTAGTLSRDTGGPVFQGYSGAGHTAAEGRNNAAMMSVPNKGPIPAGQYDIGAPHDSPHTGPYTLDLEPTKGTNTFGRSAFRIHGNNAKNDASHGCIILPPDARHAVWASGDHELRVIL